MNRETWLNEIAALMAPRFEELGFPLPRFRVAVGWTSAGKTSKVGGECWHSSNSADKVFEILCAPILDDSMEVAGVLAHELIHAAVGFQHKHKGNFEKVALAIGLQRPMTATTPGPAFKQWCQPFIDTLGNIPHAKIILRPERGAAELAEEAGDQGIEEAGGSSNAKPKQSTRMLRASCAAPGEDGQPCGYTVRLTKKWALKFGACCPVHGGMEVEGADALDES